MELVHFVDWSRVPEAEYPQRFEALKAGGVDSIVAHDSWGLPDDDGMERLPRITALAAAVGLRIPAAHGLWRRKFDLGWCEEEGLAAHRKYIAGLGDLGVRSYTVHPGFGTAPVPETFFDRMRCNTKILTGFCEDAGIVLAVENGMEKVADFERTLAVVEEIHSPYCGLCCDVGHAHCYRHDLEGVMDAMAPWLVTMHLHDNDGTRDAHDLPGNGTLDWALIGRKLAEMPRLLHVETEVVTGWDAALWLACRNALHSPQVIARKHLRSYDKFNQ